MVGFGSWKLSPMDLENPFPNNVGSVMLQRYITKKTIMVLIAEKKEPTLRLVKLVIRLLN